MIETEIKEIKQELDEIKKLLKEIYGHLIPSETLPPAKVYQLKEKARKKALEIKQKIDGE
jgi:hypothetical protein